MENTKLDDTDKSVPYGHYAAHNIIFHFSTTCQFPGSLNNIYFVKLAQIIYKHNKSLHE